MGNMKFKVGDRVRIKNIDWYNENKNHCGEIPLFKPSGLFVPDMSRYCNNIMTIKDICYGTCYRMKEDFWNYNWTDEMIEGLVEEENKPKFKVGDEVRIKGTDIGGTIESVIRGQLIVNSKGSKIPAWPEDVVLMKSVEEETKPNIIEEAKTYWDSIKDAWICPEGYIFKDENGNVINTQKIVLEKKKPKYPQSYEECCKVLEIEDNSLLINTKNITDYERDLGNLMGQLHRLIICRDAYWKIAGEELGLGKPWKPDWNELNLKFVIIVSGNKIKLIWEQSYQRTFAFPTAEMRDAFKENFDPDIEICKELL